MIDKPKLDCKYPVGNGIEHPTYQNGDTNLIPSNASANFTDAGTDINISASEENRSAKFKNPKVKQDVPDAGRNQYQEYV